MTAFAIFTKLFCLIKILSVSPFMEIQRKFVLKRTLMNSKNENRRRLISYGHFTLNSLLDPYTQPPTPSLYMSRLTKGTKIYLLPCHSYRNHSLSLVHKDVVAKLICVTRRFSKFRICQKYNIEEKVMSFFSGEFICWMTTDHIFCQAELYFN